MCPSIIKRDLPCDDYPVSDNTPHELKLAAFAASNNSNTMPCNRSALQ